MRRIMGVLIGIRVYGIVWLVLLFAASGAGAAEYRGQVVFNGLRVPGAVVTASQGDRKLSVITDAQGAYSFSDLPEGAWSIRVEMQAFSPLRKDVTIGPAAVSEKWELTLLPVDRIEGLQTPPPATAPGLSGPAAAAGAKPAKAAGRKGADAAPANTQTPFQRTEVNATGAIPPTGSNALAASTEADEAFANQDPADLSRRAADGFLISGTANNSASSPFALSRSFGNARGGLGPLYTGNIGFVLGNSALDARAYSLSGMDTEKPSYNHMQGM